MHEVELGTKIACNMVRTSTILLTSDNEGYKEAVFLSGKGAEYREWAREHTDFGVFSAKIWSS